MFEAAEVGNKVSKEDFKTRAEALHTRLLAAQRRLRGTGTAAIVVIAGVEGAGKGTVVNRLNAWLDTRGLQSFAFWDESGEEVERPRYWRFWRTLPPRGSMAILLGSWYTAPIVDHVFGRIGRGDFERELVRVADFERMLARDGALVVKLWFHLSKEAQRKRLKHDAGGKKEWKVSPLAKRFSKRYADFVRASEWALRLTDTGETPWHVVEASDWRHRDLTAGTFLAERLEQALAESPPRRRRRRPAAKPAGEPAPERERTILDRVDLGSRVDAEEYGKALLERQQELNRLTWLAWKRKRTMVALFEGWDASGKGGALRRVTAAVDARLYRVISIAAPTDEEHAQQYLWRFWRHLPRAGHATFYDRSWYGRVLVERVEELIDEAVWGAAYQEINEFEDQLTEHGIILLKFWIHISPDEQLRRFLERERIPWKAHKITDEDWRNREKWPAYEAAVNEMIARTSTGSAPWTLVAGEDKRFARLEVLRTFCRQLGSVLG